MTVSHSYPLSPVRHLPPLPPVSVCIDTDTAMPSSPVPTHALIRAHLPEGQRTIVWIYKFFKILLISYFSLLSPGSHKRGCYYTGCVTEGNEDT